MIAYFDTSALLPLVIEEPNSAAVTRIWESADRVVSVRLAYPEGRAALAMASRLGRLTARRLRTAASRYETLIDQIDIVEVTESLAHRAGDLAEQHSLRGYDAVHLAAAELLDDAVVVASDLDLCEAASRIGLATARM